MSSLRWLIKIKKNTSQVDEAKGRPRRKFPVMRWYAEKNTEERTYRLLSMGKSSKENQHLYEIVRGGRQRLL